MMMLMTTNAKQEAIPPLIWVVVIQAHLVGQFNCFVSAARDCRLRESATKVGGFIENLNALLVYRGGAVDPEDGNCAELIVETYLNNIEENLAEELSAISSTTIRPASNCPAHPLLCALQDDDDDGLTVESRQTKSMGTHQEPMPPPPPPLPNATLVFLGKFRLDDEFSYLLEWPKDNQTSIDNQEIPIVEKSLANFLLGHLNELVGQHTQSLTDSAFDDLIKQLYYKKIVCDICLSKRTRLLEQLTTGLELIFLPPTKRQQQQNSRLRPISEPPIKLLIERWNLNHRAHLIETGGIVRESIVETLLCRYARAGVLSVERMPNYDNGDTTEGQRRHLSLRLRSLESLSNLIELLRPHQARQLAS